VYSRSIGAGPLPVIATASLLIPMATGWKRIVRRWNRLGTRVSIIRQKVTTAVTRAICRPARSFAYRWIGKNSRTRKPLEPSRVYGSSLEQKCHCKGTEPVGVATTGARANGIQTRDFAEFQRFPPSFLGTSSHFSSFPKSVPPNQTSAAHKESTSPQPPVPAKSSCYRQAAFCCVFNCRGEPGGRTAHRMGFVSAAGTHLVPRSVRAAR
jgi:hypothetical protein